MKVYCTDCTWRGHTRQCARTELVGKPIEGTVSVREDGATWKLYCPHCGGASVKER